ncbi:MAG: serine/threonine-protein kinase [Chloroflexota bacterium]
MDEERLGGRYVLLDRHATGGMATVWRARDEWTREIVAIKRLHPHVVADPAARARLEREAEALRAVDHPAIVRPRELIDDPEQPALVMDFVAGRPLSERIAEGPMPAEEAVAIAGVVADALSAAHERGIVHRDIKPANILVDDDGAVHLVDFGIVALTDAPPDGLTAESTMVGTLRYAAPERLAGGEVTPRSDVWALGAVLFEMLTGRPAVAATDPTGALAASLAAPGDLEGLSPYLASVVTRAMAPDPADRYPDAVTLGDALAADGAAVDPDALTAVVPVPGFPSDTAAAPAGTAPAAALAPAAPASARRRPIEIPRAAMALVLAGLVAATAIFAVANADLGSGSRGTGTDAAVKSPSPAPATARPSPTPQPTAAKSPKPAKGKGRGKH